MSPFFLLMADHLFDVRVVDEMNQMRFRDGEIVLAVDYNLQSHYVDTNNISCCGNIGITRASDKLNPIAGLTVLL